MLFYVKYEFNGGGCYAVNENFMGFYSRLVGIRFKFLCVFKSKYHIVLWVEMISMAVKFDVYCKKCDGKF